MDKRTIALCLLCGWVGVFGCLIQAKANEPSSAEKLLAKLEELERRIEDILVRRAQLVDERKALEVRIRKLRNQEQQTEQRRKRVERHLLRQFRLLYARTPDSWIVEVLSGKSIEPLMLRRAYLSRWSELTKKLVDSLANERNRIAAMRTEMQLQAQRLSQIEAELLEEEERLRQESERYLNLLLALKRGKRERKLLERQAQQAQTGIAQQTSLGNQTLLNELKPMPCPVLQGKIVAGFGDPAPEEAAAVETSRGLWIKAQPFAEVLAPTDGLVVFARRLKGFGETVILKTTQGFFVVLARLSKRDTTEGSRIEQGRRIGAAGPNGFVYVELRVSGMPQNPAGVFKCKAK